jgi:hypothetical protein
MQSMQSVKELSSHPAPAGKPQPLTFHGGALWVGCWETSRLYAIDPMTWTVRGEFEAPGKPYGMTSFGGDLHVVISLGEQDDRYIVSFNPVKNFDMEGKIACPGFTGSHLASDGTTLFLLQATNRCILEIAADGSVRRTIKLPAACAGIAAIPGAFRAISTEDDFDTLQFASLDISLDAPPYVPIAVLPAEARALAFDGTAWWTSHREADQIVSFSVP